MRNKICIGLDFDTRSTSLFTVIKLISQTRDLVEFYKINPAFWLNKQRDLDKVIKYLNSENLKWIFDGKVGDVLHTNENYAFYYYNIAKAAGLTLNPYSGYESLEPFTRYGEKLNFLVCRTTNPGSNFLQEESYKKVLEISKKIESGLVIAGNKPELIKKALNDMPETKILCPGIGKQGGKITIKHPNIIYSASRSIINSKNPRAEVESML
jgi:orotidine-5'-phosphate decarboxylase